MSYEGRISRLLARIEMLEQALRPFSDFAAGIHPSMPDDMPLTMGSRMARRQVTAGDFRRAALAQTGAVDSASAKSTLTANLVRSSPLKRGEIPFPNAPLNASPPQPDALKLAETAIADHLKRQPPSDDLWVRGWRAGVTACAEALAAIRAAREGAMSEHAVKPYAFERAEGWPPDGEDGTYFGFDADCRCSLLRWIDGAWQGLRFVEYPQHAHVMPEAFVRTPGALPAPDIEARVVWHAPAPMEWPAREGAAHG